MTRAFCKTHNEYIKKFYGIISHGEWEKLNSMLYNKAEYVLAFNGKERLFKDE